MGGRPRATYIVGKEIKPLRRIMFHDLKPNPDTKVFLGTFIGDEGYIEIRLCVDMVDSNGLPMGVGFNLSCHEVFAFTMVAGLHAALPLEHFVVITSLRDSDELFEDFIADAVRNRVQHVEISFNEIPGGQAAKEELTFTVIIQLQSSEFITSGTVPVSPKIEEFFTLERDSLLKQ